MTDSYLGLTYKLASDNPLLLILEINRVRSPAEKPLVTEADFLADSLPDTNVVEHVNEKSKDIRMTLRQARHLLRQGLVHAIRGTGQTGSFRIMGHAVRRVHRALGDEAEKRYWLLVLQVLASLSRRALAADKEWLRALLGAEGEQSFADTCALLRDKVDELAGLVQKVEDDDLDEESAAGFLTLALNLADLSSILGLSTAAGMFTRQAQQLQGHGGGPTEEHINTIIDTLLYLECLLLETNGQAPTIARQAGIHVLGEARARLGGAMSRIAGSQEGMRGFDLNDDLHEVSDVVTGAARTSGLGKAAAIAKHCSQYARSGKLIMGLQNQALMATFADILVSLEYYPDNCRWDRNFDAAVLDIAEERLEQSR